MRRCHYCNAAPGNTKDHIVPKALSGPNAPWNYVRACAECNTQKGHRWPDCPCGVCDLAVVMYMRWKELRAEGLDWHQANRHVMDLFAEELWEIRVVRMEWWEDSVWIGNKDIRMLRASRAAKRSRRAAWAALQQDAGVDVAYAWPTR